MVDQPQGGDAQALASRLERLERLADAYEPGMYALCDGVYHVYADVPGCCQTLRDDLRAVIKRASTKDASIVEAGVASEVAAERRRQIEKHGWSSAHDDGHTNGEIASAAADYALPGQAPPSWSWAYGSKVVDKDPRRTQLIKAAALIIAEIERLDRQALSDATPQRPTIQSGVDADGEIHVWLSDAPGGEHGR